MLSIITSKVIFGTGTFQLENLLENLNYELVVSHLALIYFNFNNKSSPRTKIDQLRYVLEYEDSYLESKVRKLGRNFDQLFSQVGLLEAIRLAINHKNLFKASSTGFHSPSCQVNFLKLILEGNSIAAESKNFELPQANKRRYMEEIGAYRLLLKHYEFENHRFSDDLLSQLCKVGYLKKFLIKNQDRLQIGAEKIDKLVNNSHVFQLFFNSVEKDEQGRPFPVWVGDKIDPTLTKVLKELALDVKNQVVNSIFDFKKHPLLYVNGKFVVLDWGLLIRKIHDGVKYDLLHESSINKTTYNEGYFEFIVQHLLSSIFGAQNVINLNTINTIKSKKADFICISRNKILIVECKNNEISIDYKLNCNEVSIKSYIDSRFRNRAFVQLESTINWLLENRGYLHFGERQVLFVYPVVLVEDVNFGCPGWNQLVNKCYSFKSNFSSKNLFIEEATLLQIDTLIDAINIFEGKPKALFDTISAYQRRISKKRVNLDTPTEELMDIINHQEQFDSFCRSGHKQVGNINIFNSTFFRVGIKEIAPD